MYDRPASRLGGQFILKGKDRIMEKITIQFTTPLLYDKLHTLAAEYSITAEQLINLAVKRLIDDVDFVRNLRTGKIKLE